MTRDPWSHLGLHDRETLLTGLLAWFMDPQGNHGLGDAFLLRTLRRYGVDRPSDSTKLAVRTEEVGRGGRVDIMVREADAPLLILEVKCRTTGDAGQLHRYLQAHPESVIGRLAFGEWNFPDLGPDDQTRFPLRRLNDLGQDLETEVPNLRAFSDLASSLIDHLREESRAFEELGRYYVTEERDEPPTSRRDTRLGRRFEAGVLLRRIRERLENERGEEHRKVGNERSGSWLAGWNRKAEAGEALVLDGLGITIPGPVGAWIHLEIDQGKSLFGPADETVGKAQLRIHQDQDPPGHRALAFESLLASKGRIQDNKFELPGRRPGSGSYYSALTRPLNRRDLRYSNLVSLLDGPLAMRTILMEPTP